MRDALLKAIEAWQGKRVLVIGDVCRDEWIECVPRVNPEADAPCFTLLESTRFDFGMAKLVADLVDSLGGKAVLLSRQEMSLKTRLMADGKQLARFDRDPIHWMFPNEERELLVQAWKIIRDDGVGAVVLSDYGKGTCTPKVCRTLMVRTRCLLPVLVDPVRGAGWMKYSGATWVKANEIEFADWSLGGGVVKSSVIRTLGSSGIAWVGGAVPATPRKVVDSCGCGDACAAVLGLCLAVGAPIDLACHLANHAGGLAVEQSGTPRITADMLRDDVAALPVLPQRG